MRRVSNWFRGLAPAKRALAVICLIVGLGIVVGTAARGGADKSSAPSTSPPRGDTANLWVNPTAGSCSRSAQPQPFDQGTACPSLSAAYNAANASSDSSRVLVKGGSYAGEVIQGNRSSTNVITFKAAPGKTPLIRGKVQFGPWGSGSSFGPDYVTLDGISTAQVGAGYETPTNRWGMFVFPGASHVRILNAHAGSIGVFGAKDVLVKDDELGPCLASKTDGIPGSGPCSINYIDYGEGLQGQDVTYDHDYIHDYRYAPTCAAAGDCHYRSMYFNGANRVTIRNSTIRDSVFAPWFTISGPDAARSGNSNILVENNQFGSPVDTSADSFQLAWCSNARRGVTGYRNVTIRFNSFAPGNGSLTPPGTNGPHDTCRLSNVNVYGNVMVKGYCQADESPQHGNDVGRVNWAYNVFVGSSACAGVGNVVTRSSTVLFYAKDTREPAPGGYAVTGARAPSDNLVPAAHGCPATDARGVRRRGMWCDAGAFERGARRIRP